MYSYLDKMALGLKGSLDWLSSLARGAGEAALNTVMIFRFESE